MKTRSHWQFRILSLWVVLAMLLGSVSPAWAQAATPTDPTAVQGWAISGRVTALDGSPLPGATIRADDTHSALSGADGSYTLSGLPDGRYVVTPALDGVLLLPYYREITLAGEDRAGVDFYQAAAAPQPPSDLPRVPAPAAAGSDEVSAQAAFSAGKPGLAYGYQETIGQTGQPYQLTGSNLNAPRGLGLDGAGYLLITEDQGMRVLQFDSAGTRTLTLGTAGVADFDENDGSYFRAPYDAAFDDSGNIWVVDENKLLRYDSSGSRNLVWISEDHNVNFDYGFSVLYRNGRLYVSDPPNNRVQIYDITRFGGPDNPHIATINDLNGPRGLSSPQDDLLYVAEAGSSTIRHCWVGDPNNINCFTSFGEMFNANGDLYHLNGPRGVAATDNRIYIADLGNSRVLSCNRQSNGNVDSCNTLAGVSGEPGGDDAHLRWPTDVAADNNKVYVADRNNMRVQVFDPMGTLTATYGESGVPFPPTPDASLLYQPAAVLRTEEAGTPYLYILEGRGTRLLKINADTRALMWKSGESGVAGSGSSQFSSDFDEPGLQMAVDGLGRIYVPDPGNQRVKIYLPNGSMQAQMGETAMPGSDNAHFDHPTAVAIDSAGRIYVTDSWNQRVQIFDASRNYLATLGETGVSGADNAHFSTPTSAAVTPDGETLYIADRENQRVQKCARSASGFDCAPFAGITGVAGNEYTRFNRPISVAVGPQGRVYIADANNDRVLVFDPNGAFRASIGGRHGGLPSGALRSPMGGLWVTPDDHVYVADFNNQRVQVYQAITTDGFGWEALSLPGITGQRMSNAFALASDSSVLYASGITEGKAKVWRYDPAAPGWTIISPDNLGEGPVDSYGEGLSVYNGQLIAGVTYNDETTPGRIWACALPCQNAAQWQMAYVLQPNHSAATLEAFNGYLYLGGWSPTGPVLYRSANGLSWAPVPSLAVPANQGSITALAVYNSKLYMGTFPQFSGAAPQVWSSANGTTWTQETGFTAANTNWGSMSMAAFGGKLYVGTFTDLQDAPHGGELWVLDGSSWSHTIADGLGEADNVAVKGMLAVGSELYVTMRNSERGLTLYKTADGSTWNEVLTDATEAGFGNSNNHQVYSGNASLANWNGRVTLAAMNNYQGGSIWAQVPSAHQISGTITLAAVPLADVTLTLQPGGRTTTTDAAGAYQFAGVAHGSAVTVVPSHPLYNFTPATQSSAALNANAVWNFNAAARQPIQLLAPADGTWGVSLAPLLDWTDMPGAKRYEVQIALNSGFAPVLRTITSTISQFPVTGLLSNTQYYWRVRSCTNTSGACLGSIFGEASATSGFHTLNSALLPVLGAPAAGAKQTTLTPTFGWDAAPRAALPYYRIQISQSPNFTTLDLDEYVRGGKRFFTPESDLTAARQLFWRVQGYDSQDHPLGWSLVRNLYTPPAAVQLNSPQPDEAISRLAARFEWFDPFKAGSYTLQISDDDTFVKTLVNVTVSTPGYTVPAALPADTWLYWRVSAKGPGGIIGPWSEVRMFGTPTPPPIPTPKLPAAGTIIPCGDNATPTTFTWKGSPNTDYELQYSSRADFQTGPDDYERGEGGRWQMSFTTDPFYFQCNRTIYWRVRGHRNVMGTEQWSNWSAAARVVTQPRQPRLNWPEDGFNSTGGVAIRANWNYDDDNRGISYEVQACKVNPDGLAGGVCPAASVITSFITTNNDGWINLPPSATSYWRVRARGVGGPGLWTPSRSVTTPAAPAAPALLLPAANATPTTAPIRLSWSPVAGATGYQVYISSSPTTLDGAFVLNTGDKTYFNWEGTDGGVYYWTALAYGGAPGSPIYGPIAQPLRKLTARGSVDGRVADAITGAGLTNATASMATVGTQLIDGDEMYFFNNLLPGVKTTTFTEPGYFTQVRSITAANGVALHQDVNLVPKPAAPGTYTVILTWNGSRNLDAHFWLPGTPAANTHVYAGSLSGLGAELAGTYDQFTGGPEVITITSLQPGTSTFGVYLQGPALPADLKATGALVEVYQGTTLKGSFPVSAAAGTGQWWNVFTLTNTGVLTAVKKIQAAAPGDNPQYTISGEITNDLGGKMPGVRVDVDRTGRSVTPWPGNRYEVTNLTNGDYQLSPSHMGFNFTPQTVTINGASQVKNLQGTPKFSQGSGVVTRSIARGHFLYQIVGTRLQIVDVRNPASPVFHSAGAAGGYSEVYDLAIDGDYAYLAQGREGLLIFNIADPMNPPVLVGQFLSTASIRRVAANGRYLYLFGNNNTVRDDRVLITVDVQNPAQPREINIQPVNYDPQQMLVHQGRLFSAGLDNCLNLYDLGDPSRPQWQQRRCYNNAYVQSMAISGDVVYFGGVHSWDAQGQLVAWNFNTGWWREDNFNPCNSPLTAGMVSMTLMNDTTLAIACGRAGLKLVNVANVFNNGFQDITPPPAPQQSFMHVTSADGILYAVRDSSGDELAMGVEMGSFVTYATLTSGGPQGLNNALALSADNSLVYTTEGYNQVVVRNAVNGAALGSLVLTNNTKLCMLEDMKRVDSNLFVAGGDGLYVLDITTPTAPTETGKVMWPGADDCAASVAVKGSYAYLVGRSGLVIVDISNPAAPNIVGQITDGSIGWASDVVVYGDTAYIAAGFNGLQIVDVTNPAAPILQPGRGVENWAFQLDVYDQPGTDPDYLYVASGTLTVFNISNNPLDPQEVNRMLQWALPWRLKIDAARETMYVGTDSWGLGRLDLSDPANPMWVDNLDVLNAVFGMDINPTTGELYIAGSSLGMFHFVP